jgi:hypothetical protein
MDRRMWDGLVDSMRETWVATMAMGGVPPPMLMVVDGSRLVGYVQLRTVTRGNDASTAIAEMSALAAAARATDVAIFYEMQDVAIACDHSPLQSGTAMAAVDASPDERVIYRFPYAEKRLLGRAPGGMIPASPEWLSAPAPDPGGDLEPAIECLLEFCWQPLQLPGLHDPRKRIESADAWLRHEGYRVGLTVPQSEPRLPRH